MLVDPRFYRRFASFLAVRGMHVYTYANRGVGSSFDAETTAIPLRLQDWGERDLPAMIDHAGRLRPGDRLFVVGHSMGGQLVALTDSVHRLEGIVTVAATDAWLGHWPLPDRLAVAAWYGVAVPVLGRVLDTFPAHWIRMGPPVRSCLVRDWARWGRHRDYLRGPFGMRPTAGEYTGRLLVYSFADDRLGVRAAVDAHHRHYNRAAITRRDVADGSVGHFGFFRDPGADRFWPEVLRWIGVSESA